MCLMNLKVMEKNQQPNELMLMDRDDNLAINDKENWNTLGFLSLARKACSQPSAPRQRDYLEKLDYSTCRAWKEP